jgi:hypothetical protein
MTLRDAHLEDASFVKFPKKHQEISRRAENKSTILNFMKYCKRMNEGPKREAFLS